MPPHGGNAACPAAPAPMSSLPVLTLGHAGSVPAAMSGTAPGTAMGFPIPLASGGVGSGSTTPASTGSGTPQLPPPTPHTVMLPAGPILGYPAPPISKAAIPAVAKAGSGARTSATAASGIASGQLDGIVGGSAGYEELGPCLAARYAEEAGGL